MNIKNIWKKFMYGRNGLDAVSYGLGVIYILIAVINLFANSYIIYALLLCIAAAILFRALSKNVLKRRKENEIFLRFLKKMSGHLKILILRIKEIKTHRYKKCPHCKNMLRLPKRTGKNTVLCPRCNNRFII